MRYTNFTPEHEAEFQRLSSDGVTAVFVYTEKLIHCGKRVVYNSEDKKVVHWIVRHQIRRQIGQMFM